MKNAIVVDLDGTLLKTNSFIHFIKFVCKEALFHGNICLFVWISILVTLRKVRLISSHEKLKKEILKCSRHYTDNSRMEKLATNLIGFENHEVVAILNKYRNSGYSTVLSTAAPEVYAKIVGKRYDFDYICSTVMPNFDEWHENVNVQKKKNTLSLLEINSLKLAVLVTDHYDDMPLLLIDKEENYVVNPSEKSKRIIENEYVKCKYVYGE